MTVTTSVSCVNLDAMLDAWYIKYGMKPHPNLKEHDILHALLGEGVTWQSEIRVGVIDYVYRCLTKGKPLTMEGARTFLAGVVEAVHRYHQEEAYDFLSDKELSQRITASVKILRSVGIENI